jgi:hypothetical protein
MNTLHVSTPGNVSRLRDAVAQLLKGPEKRAKMEANGRRITVTEHASTVQTRRYAVPYKYITGGLQGGC